jgi:hypothetical protein
MNQGARDLTNLGVKDVQAFVARVLGRAHESAMTLGAADDAREVLELAHLFANDMERADPTFDRAAFIRAVFEEQS